MGCFATSCQPLAASRQPSWKTDDYLSLPSLSTGQYPNTALP